jgi:hypothetical protein
MEALSSVAINSILILLFVAVTIMAVSLAMFLPPASVKTS